MDISRRLFMLGAVGATAAPGWAAAAAGEVDRPGQPLRPWREGGLDIHHIATGRGDCTLVIGPDGSSLMIDAGASATPAPPAFAIRPGPDHRAGEWAGRYALRRLRDTGGSGIDTFLATHQHPDHIGDVGPGDALAPSGSYRLTGVSDVDAIAPIHRLIDRGFPNYDRPAPSDAPFQKNYEAFVRARVAAGRPTERFRAGALNQLRKAEARHRWPDFAIRNLAVNGEVWTGHGDQARLLFPPMDSLAKADRPDENAWSAAIRLSYGRFGYFAAGDLTANTFEGALPWRDVETAAARAAGRVDVALCPHHGMFDATGADAVRALQARIWIVSAWHALHPSPSTLNRLFNSRLQPIPPLVLATGIPAELDAAAPWLSDRLTSKAGHVIIRVAPGGSAYRVIVTDHKTEEDHVVAAFGPFLSGG